MPDIESDLPSRLRVRSAPYIVQRMTDTSVRGHLIVALECSVYVAPLAYGLSQQEIFEVGHRLGFKDGEIGDAMRGAVGPYLQDGRFTPRDTTLWADFMWIEDPEYRSAAAFDAACIELQEVVRDVGREKAALERRTLVERATQRGASVHDVEVAVTMLLLAERFVEKEGRIAFSPGKESYILASKQVENERAHGGHTHNRPLHGKVFPIVKDVIARRADGRSARAEPLDAFPEALTQLGHAKFRMWWLQMTNELRRADPAHAPVTVVVLSAALVEGALTFAVKHARASKLAVFASSDFDREPRTWKIDDLVKSACAGRHEAIFDDGLRKRADDLVHARQRIHAGRMLSEFPSGAPDLRPEEARDARATAEAVVRAILDWFEKFPPQ